MTPDSPSISDSAISVPAPPGLGVVEVFVSRDGTLSNAVQYGPITVSLTPNRGPDDTPVTISGRGSNKATDVVFGQQPAREFRFESDEEIQARAPGRVGDGRRHRRDIGRTVKRCRILGPTFMGLMPNAGPPETEVTIFGRGFVDVRDVLFGQAPAREVIVGNDAQIQARSPDGVGTVDVVVHTFGGASNTVQYRYIGN